MKRMLWQLIATLFVVGFVLAYWWIIALVIAALVLWKVAPIVYRRYRVAEAAKQAALRGLEARADQQHRWVLAGDERGVFGTYPPTS
jgi:hypothetical protein